MILNKVFSSSSIQVIFLLSMVAISCSKDDTDGIVSDILGKWQTTTFQVSECPDESDNIESRSCGLSDEDDVECGFFDFRSNGTVVVDEGTTSEETLTFVINNDVVTITDPQTSESFTAKFVISGNTLNLDFGIFPGAECALNVNYERVN
jgi:hypothetical protein